MKEFLKKIRLTVITRDVCNPGESMQNRHENLVKLINSYDSYAENPVKIIKKVRSTSDCEKFLTVNEINTGVVFFTDLLNLPAGSSGSVDLYKLLQNYLLDPEIRDQINSICKI